MRGDPFGEFQRDKNLLKKPGRPEESLLPYFYTLRLVKNPNWNLDNSQQVLVHQRLSWRCTQAVRFFSSGCGKSACHCFLNVGSSSHTFKQWPSCLLQYASEITIGATIS